MSRCPDILAWQAFVDAQCEATEAAPLRAHLASCSMCATLVRELEAARLPLPSLSEEPPEGLLTRLQEAVRQVRPAKPLSCRRAQIWLAERLDGRLPRAAEERLEAHLWACSSCYRAAQEFQTLTELLRATAKPTLAPLGLLPRLRAAVAEIASGTQRRVSFSRRALVWAGLAAASAMLLLVFFKPFPFQRRYGVSGPLVAEKALSTVASRPMPRWPAAPPKATTEKGVSQPTAQSPPAQPQRLPRAIASAPLPAVMRATPLPTPRLQKTAREEPPLAPAKLAQATEAPPPAPIATPALSPSVPDAETRPIVPEHMAARPTETPGQTRPIQPALASLPSSKAEMAPPAMPQPAPTDSPRVTAEPPKPTPREEAPAAWASAEPPRRWISRPAAPRDNERIFARAEEFNARLADASAQLAREAREINQYRPPGIPILHFR